MMSRSAVKGKEEKMETSTFSDDKDADRGRGLEHRHGGHDRC